MVLQLNKNGSLKTFQQQFNEYYPFLKIEFFKKITSGESLTGSGFLARSGSESKINRSADQSVSIDVNRKRKIAELEKDFDNLLGLSAHVFRKSGNVWVETSLTNEWSLEDQNEEGKQISRHFKDNES
ncbi:MAG TPA: hypothetical protein VKR53_18495 [Puia sp.]|nr:hypothetical protein [Puia sp.]